MATGRIGVTPTLRTRWSKQPTAGTTSLSGLDDNSVALVYDVGYEAVYRNGTLLSRGNDYTATTGTTVTLIDATLAGDIIEILANQLVPLTDAISKGQFTAKGALLSATAASTPGVLAVGANDTVLTADSTASTGLKWATPAAGGMTLLSTTTLSGTLTTVSSISSAYNDLFIIVQGAVWGTASDSLQFKFNTSATNIHGVLNLNNNGATSSSLISSGNITSGPSFPVNTGGANIFNFTITNYANTSYYKTFATRLGFPNSTTFMSGHGGGQVMTTSAITSFSVETTNAYTFSAGQILIYGVK